MADVSNPHISNMEGDPWKRCWRYGVVNIFIDRVFPCCAISGQALMRNIDIGKISVPVKTGWQKALDDLPLTEGCRKCSWETPLNSY